ncbi:hypothetical protein ACROYT_G007644 [Oculina patagonica]
MIEASLRRFAQENFGDRYFQVLHGETANVKPLALVVKQRRSIWKRPYAGMEIVILAGLERYVESGTKEAFLESVTSKITEEEISMKQTISMGTSSHEFHVEMDDHLTEGTFNSNDDRGVLQLGKLNQKYISDPDLRLLLANTVLDTTKLKGLEDEELLLATSVIYSDKFVLKGNRKHQIEIPPFANILMPNVKMNYTGTYIPPELASRSSQAPFLFKCCRVRYNKEINRLEICKGEYVGKKVTAEPGNLQDSEYVDIMVDLDTDENDDLSDSFSAQDFKKLDIITKEVLLAEKTRERRKARVSKYLQWFEQALTTGQNELLLDEPLTSEDCRFLKSISLPGTKNSTMLDLTTFTKKAIQGYGIVFKNLHELPEQQWKEFETTFAADATK